MLLERSQVIVGAIFAVVLGLGTVGAIVVDRSLISGGANVTAMFTDAAGLQAGDTVLVAGLRAGTVQKVAIEGDHAKAVLRVTETMPSDSRADIVLQNFLGKRAVMLVAGERWDDPLAEGDVIPLERTSTPVDYAEFNEESEKLIDETDVDALRQLITSVADITEGQREEVDRLLTGLQRITDVVADKKEELGAVIARSEEVFGTLAEEDQELVTIIDAFGSTLDRLAERREELVALLENTARSSQLTADLVAEDRQQLDRVLEELRRDLDIVDAHQVDLAHMFAYGGVSFEGYANIAVSGNRENPYWANIFVQSIAGEGVDPIAGCGGAIDEFLDQVFGEDPRTCAEQSAEEGAPFLPEGHEDGGSTSSLRGLFTLHREVLR